MNNEEKNTYVKQQITRTLIQLLEEKDISDISIKELCDTAMIGRASFGNPCRLCKVEIAFYKFHYMCFIDWYSIRPFQ